MSMTSLSGEFLVCEEQLLFRRDWRRLHVPVMNTHNTNESKVHSA